MIKNIRSIFLLLQRCKIDVFSLYLVDEFRKLQILICKVDETTFVSTWLSQLHTCSLLLYRRPVLWRRPFYQIQLKKKKSYFKIEKHLHFQTPISAFGFHFELWLTFPVLSRYYYDIMIFPYKSDLYMIFFDHKIFYLCISCLLFGLY